MDVREKRFFFSIVSGIVILSVSLFVAFICFKLLASSAEGTLKGWKLGGAFAGFVFTASMLTSIVFQFYKQMTGEQVEEYRQLVQELQAKLIKGAPCPDGFTVDIDERHKLVFARPETWIPQGGLLYQYVNKCKTGHIPANFNVVYLSDEDLKEYYPENPGIKIGASDLNELYKRVIDSQITILGQSFPAYEHHNLTQEYTTVDAMKCVKYTHQFSYSAAQPDNNAPVKVSVCQTRLFSYVPRLKGLFVFTFSDDSHEYLTSSEVFNSVISSIRYI